MAEQLAVGRDLTKKLQDNQSSDDEADDEATSNIPLSQDPMNPWMMQRSDKSNINAEFDFGYKKFVQNKMNKQNNDSDSDSNDEHIDNEDDAKNNELDVLKASISKLSQGENQDEESVDDEVVPAEKDNGVIKPVNKRNTCQTETQQIEKEVNQVVSNPLFKESKKTVAKPKVSKPVATSNWEVEAINDTETKPSEDILLAFESHETSVAQKVEKKLREIRRNIERLEKAGRANKRETQKIKETQDRDNLEYLKLKNKKVKAVIDEELIETSSKTAEDQESKEKDEPLSKILNTAQAPVQESADSNIDTNKLTAVKPKYLNSAISQGENEYDQLDDDQVVPRVNIEGVFEEDDVVASFRQEKEDEMNKDKPEDINRTLPGWGAWGGKGVKPQKRKRNRFILNAPPKIPRRDENKGDIIIKEFKDPKLAIHKVKDVPFPFESVKDYEASIRAPLGNTFIPEKAHKELIRPSVITKAGKIIEPMDEEELLVPKNRNFKNEGVIKLLGQKK